jgi:Beta-lactamase class C and other penicillin binding proteins
MDRRRFLTLLAGAALATPSLIGCVARAATRPAQRWTAVQRMIDGYVADRKVAGAAVALSYGGTALAYPAAGRIALGSPVRFDENSLCRIYSMTKPVTGVAAMTLIEDGKIALDQPVADVLPEFRSLHVAIDLQKSMESRPAVKTMTMRHLLTHTSGLSYWTPLSGVGALPTAYRERGITPGNYGAGLNRPGYGPQAKNLVEMVERVAELPLAYEPGTAFNYSIGLDVMGLVIERVTGKGFDVFLRERLFESLDMSSTGFQVAPKNAACLTTNYHVTPDGLKPTDTGAASVWLRPSTPLAGGAGLVSTARDFARFGAMLLGDGALGRIRVMKPETARLARSNLLPAGVVYSGGGGFGAGARVVVPGGDRRFGPLGSFGWGGAAGTVWWIDPARRGNMVFMAQFMPPDSYPVRDEIAAAIEADLKQRKH